MTFFLMSPPRSGSNFLQSLLSVFFPGQIQTTTYHNQQPFSSNILMVKSHADTYIRLLSEIAMLKEYPVFPSKFLIIIRDPRLSSISAYEYGARKLGKSQGEFLYSPNYGPDCPGLFKGNYLSYLKNFFETWLQYCQNSGAMMVRFESLVTDYKYLLKVIEFLGVGHEVQNDSSRKYNKRICSISEKLEKKWQHVARLNHANDEISFPQKQYPSEFSDLSEYEEITEVIKVEILEHFEKLGYDIGYNTKN